MKYNKAAIFICILLSAVLLCSCQTYETDLDFYTKDYRGLMRQWVMLISATAKTHNPDFIIIAQNCSPLFTETGLEDGKISREFLDCIDGAGQEGILYGNDRYNSIREDSRKKQITDLLNIGIENGISVLSVNYCDSKYKVEEAIEYDVMNGYVSFLSPSYELNEIPPNLINENINTVSSLKNAENWLFLLNPEKYKDKEEYINALCDTNYDILVIDAFFHDDIMLSHEDVSRLQIKSNGAKRLVICYLSIGEAEDYRYYWKKEYDDNPPEWILSENPNWEGNYPVKYWDEEWQNIIATGKDSYLRRILKSGFDGVYLDIVDGYQTFEDLEEEKGSP